MPQDKTTIGVTVENQRTLDTIEEQGNFEDQMDAARFAFAYAIRRNIEPSPAEAASTKWNVGSFDPDRSLRAVIEALFPDQETPYRAIEGLINEGLRLLQARLDDEGFFEPLDVIESA